MIDICVSLNGPHVGLMLPFFLDSLRETTDVGNIVLHLVERGGCSQAVRDFMVETARGWDGSIALHSLTKTFKECNVADRVPFDNTAYDTAGAMQWMLKNCGTEDWCYISHFDVEFLDDLIGHYHGNQGPLNEGMGQVGAHATGLVGYRRIAVEQCSVNFTTFSGCYLVKDHRNVWVVRHGGDSRCTDKSLLIHGWDVAELLELN